jgi:RHS repeat-associated protein
MYIPASKTHLYQGKQLEDKEGLNWYDFHARRFDSQLGRWHAIDPVIQFASPYVGMGNNPVIGVDPKGKFAGIPPWLMEYLLNHYCRMVNLKEVEITDSYPQSTNFNWWNDFQKMYNTSQGGGNTQWQYQAPNTPSGSGGGHGNSGSYNGPWSSEYYSGNDKTAEEQENSNQTATEIENLTKQIEEKYNVAEKTTIALNAINDPVNVTTEVIDNLSGAVKNSDLVNFGTLTGKSIGLFGVGVTFISSVSDGRFTVGDSFRIAIGIATVFIPYAGPIYGVIDVGVLVVTGKSATDRFGDFIDYQLGP